jgi:thioredoxin
MHSQNGALPATGTSHDRFCKRSTALAEAVRMTTRNAADDGASSNGVRAEGDPELIRTVGSDTFDALVLRGHGPIAVEFMSYGCAHCRAIEPFLRKAARMVKAKEQIFRVNVAVEPDLAESYQIVGTPTLVMFLDAREVGRVEGPRPTLSAVLGAITEAFA